MKMIKNKSKKFSQKVKFAKFWLNVCWICAIVLQLLIAFLGVDLLFVNASLGFFMLALIQEVRLSKYELLKRIEAKESPLFVFKCEQQVERINRGKDVQEPRKSKSNFRGYPK